MFIRSCKSRDFAKMNIAEDGIWVRNTFWMRFKNVKCFDQKKNIMKTQLNTVRKN